MGEGKLRFQYGTNLDAAVEPGSESDGEGASLEELARAEKVVARTLLTGLGLQPAPPSGTAPRGLWMGLGNGLRGLVGGEEVRPKSGDKGGFGWILEEPGVTVAGRGGGGGFARPYGAGVGLGVGKGERARDGVEG